MTNKAGTTSFEAVETIFLMFTGLKMVPFWKRSSRQDYPLIQQILLLYKKRKAIENKSDPFYFGTVSEEECISLSQYLEPFSISPVAISSRIMGSTICFKPLIHHNSLKKRKINQHWLNL